MNEKKGMLIAFAVILVLAIAVVAAPLAPSQLSAQPALPHLFYGTLYADGAPAPVGTVVEAKVNGVVRGTITTTEVGIYATFTFNPLLVQGVANGATIVFYANGAECSPTAIFQAGSHTELNLTVTGPPPTPSPTPTPSPPEGFHAHYAFRHERTGQLRDSSVDVGEPQPTPPKGWEVIQILIKE